MCRAFYANQWDNLDNRKAHFENTGPEIDRQVQALTGNQVDAFSCAVGTGGTISGVGNYLKSQHPAVKICLTDPHGAGLANYFKYGKLKSEGSSISEGKVLFVKPAPDVQAFFVCRNRPE